MKADDVEGFKPITVTLESQGEVDLIYELLYSVKYHDTHLAYGIARDVLGRYATDKSFSYTDKLLLNPTSEIATQN